MPSIIKIQKIDIKAFLCAFLLLLPGFIKAQETLNLDAIANSMQKHAPDMEAILSAMGTDSEIDGILAAMQGPDFDLLTASMTTEGDILSSVADEMAFNSSLDYLTGLLLGNNSETYRTMYRGGGPIFSGEASLPISGRMTSGYGYRRSYGRMHKGVDIALQEGDTVRAALNGVVTRVDFEAGGYGNFIVVRHADGLETRYAHLNGSIVAEGDNVVAGQPIGIGGNTGNSTGPHLHFETRLYGVAFDPTTIFDFSMPAGMTGYRTLATLDHAVTPKTGTAKTELAGKGTYVVRPGDTIASVAQRAGISKLALCRLNALNSSSTLSPGTMLRLR